MVDTILIVDDEPREIESLRDRLQFEGYEVISASSGAECILKLQDRLPNLVILDLRMGGLSGIETCQRIRENPRTKNIPILIFSSQHGDSYQVEALNAGADHYIEKTEGRPRFLAWVRRRIDIGRTQDIPRNCTLAIKVSERVDFQLSGATSKTDACLNFQVDHAAFNSEMAFMARLVYRYYDMWRSSEPGSATEADYLSERVAWLKQAKNKVKELNKEFEKCSPFMVAWGLACGKVGASLDLMTLRFSGPPQNLALPFELMSINKGEPIAVSHPMSRQITVGYTAKSGWRAFLESNRGKTIRALLIAGDAATVQEIENVAKALKKLESAAKLKIEIAPPDLSRPLSRSEAETLLKTKRHHLIHFAGHGEFDYANPPKSAMVLEEGVITAAVLKDLLNNSFTQFLYLSCCCGAEIADQNLDKESQDRLLGLMDAAVKAGTEAVFGYRWPVVGREARTIATEFYEFLSQRPYSLEHAALHARRYIYHHSEEADQNDAWFSPMLVLQNPD